MLGNQSRNVATFNSANFGELRTQVNQEGKVWFCLNDVARALGLVNPRKVVERLSKRGVTTSDTPTQNQHGSVVIQSMTYIDEPNLYRCIFQSRKQEAETFQTWVFEEVLPSIRQTGGYISTQQDDTPELIMARALQVAQSTIERHKQRIQMLEDQNTKQQEQIVQLAPKAEYTDAVLQSTSTYTFTQIAHDLGMRSVRVLMDELKSRKMIYRQSDQWQPTAKVADKGYFATRTAKYIKSDGSIGTSISTVVTESGRQFIHTLISK